MTIEDKVNNTLKWLANQIACIQVYHWDEEYKKKSLNDAWQKVQEQFKEDIDWNSLTESQCKALHFGRWQSEKDIEEQISFLKSELEKGHLTKEEFDKKVANEKNTIGLRLIPLYLYPSLPIGIILTSIDGKEIAFDGSNIDTDVRFGCLAWGIKPKKGQMERKKKRDDMDANKITLAGYIAYLQGMYKQYGNISITNLKHIERNRKRKTK